MGRSRHAKKRGRRSPRRFRDRPIAAVLQWVVCAGALGGTLYGFYCYLHASPVFAVQWVRVEGASVLDPETVLAASGITTADNLLFFDADAAHDRVENMPYVKTCHLTREFPDRVTLALEERSPVATLLVSNHLFEIDAEGVVLRELPADQMHSGPLVTNVAGLDYVEPGQAVSQPGLVAALAVWAAFSHTAMAHEVTVSELAAFGKNDVVMYCDELPFEIRWGRSDFAGQAWRLNLLWRESGGQLPCRASLDLRFGEQLVCK